MLSETLALHRDRLLNALITLGFTGTQALVVLELWNRKERAFQRGREWILARLDSFKAASKRTVSRTFKKLRELGAMDEEPELAGRSSAAIIKKLRVQLLFDLSRQSGAQIRTSRSEASERKTEEVLNSERDLPSPAAPALAEGPPPRPVTPARILFSREDEIRQDVAIAWAGSTDWDGMEAEVQRRLGFDEVSARVRAGGGQAPEGRPPPDIDPAGVSPRDRRPDHPEMGGWQAGGASAPPDGWWRRLGRAFQRFLSGDF